MTTKLFGEPVRRREDARLIIGAGRYLDDIGAGAYAAAFVRSPHAHARVVDVDVSAALDVEGLATEDHQGEQVLHPVQEAFRECHALQCGFCTPGFLMTIAAGLEGRDAAEEITEEEVDDIVGGNLCRCTGYANIKKAVRHAAAAMGETHHQDAS